MNYLLVWQHWKLFTALPVWTRAPVADTPTREIHRKTKHYWKDTWKRVDCWCQSKWIRKWRVGHHSSRLLHLRLRLERHCFGMFCRRMDPYYQEVAGLYQRNHSRIIFSSRKLIKRWLFQFLFCNVWNSRSWLLLIIPYKIRGRVEKNVLDSYQNKLEMTIINHLQLCMNLKLWNINELFNIFHTVMLSFNELLIFPINYSDCCSLLWWLLGEGINWVQLIMIPFLMK